MDNIFTECLEEDLASNENLLEAFMDINGNQIVMKIIKHVVFNSNSITELFRSNIDELNKIAREAIINLDAQEYIEQKTPKWFAVRENMFSASTIGYLNSALCGTPLSKEIQGMKEKSGMIPKKSFCGWLQSATKHGQQFEDVCGDIYDVVNNLVSKEYGILTDETHKHIGASPDGIIVDLKEQDFFTKLKMGRMREIKNPVSRAINNVIPRYYYFQMLQQLYVAKLPFCDFIQSDFKYPIECTFDTFRNDTMTQDMLDECKTMDDLFNLFGSYILENLKFNEFRLNEEISTLIMNEPVSNINQVLLSLLKKNWNNLSYFPLSNINKRGFLKGIHWSFVRYNTATDVDFMVEWLPITESYDQYYNNEELLNTYLEKLKDKYLKDGYILEQTLYWDCQKYSVIEVEYNETYYEGKILPELHNKWTMVDNIRNAETIKEKEAIFNEHSPYQESEKKKTRKKKVNTALLYDLGL